MNMPMKIYTFVAALLLLTACVYSNKESSKALTEDCLPKVLKQYEEDLSTKGTEITIDYSFYKGEGTCKDGEPEGNWKIYYQRNENLYMEVPYLKGKIHGTRKRYDWKNGWLLEEKTFEEGIAINVAKMYYDTGELSRETPYDNGAISGIERVYYKDGKILSETPWFDNRRHGVMTSYHKNGKVKSEMPYVFGLRHGVAKIYDKNGSLKEKTEYANNGEVKK